MPHIYILELAEGHYFIGRIDDDTELGPISNQWTELYPIQRIDKIVRNITPSGEIDMLLYYMTRYGGTNVHTDLLCYRCGRQGHYQKVCKTRWHISDYEIED
jgi:hypothetical protein